VDLPTTPRNLNVTVSTSADLELIVTWIAPSDTGASDQSVSVLTSYLVEETTTNQSVNVSVDFSLRTLVRSSLSKGYIYSYRITAINPAGSSSPSTLVSEMAISKPSSPLVLTSEIVGSLSLFFQWSPPIDPGNLGYGTLIRFRRYQLSVIIHSSLFLVENIMLSADSTNYTISPSNLGLNPGVLYVFRLVAQNAAGSSLPADVLQTPVALPSAPLSLSAVVTSPLQITISWALPANTGGISQELPISNYTLLLSLSPTLSNPIVLSRGLAQFFVHENLVKAQMYFYTVIAENKAGQGPAAGPVNEEGVVLPAPPGLTVVNSAELELTATWTVPPDTGTGGRSRPVVAYLLEQDTVAASNGSFAGSRYGVACYTAQTPPCDPTQPSPAAVLRGVGQTMTFPELTKGMTHYFRVTAINSAGAGPASVVVARQALVLPTVPRRFEMEISSANESLALMLRWMVPDETGAGITSLGQRPPSDSSQLGQALTGIQYISQVLA
jgi:hypothetical protein